MRSERRFAAKPQSLYMQGKSKKLERAKGFEPSTPTLARLCSTPELHPLIPVAIRGSVLDRWASSCGDGRYMA